MNTRALLRWSIAIVTAVGLLGVIGLALNPPVQARPQTRPQARVTTVYDWPAPLPPCNGSLQQCLDAAVVLPGDTIRVKPGVYTASVTLAKPVNLVGDNRFATVLLAEPGQRVLTVTGNLSYTTVISGLTFKQGQIGGPLCPDACGGGIALLGVARPTLQNIVLQDNSALQGGGLWVEGGLDVKLVNVWFVHNMAGTDGGGLWTMADTQLFNANFESNTAANSGGGVYVEGAMPLAANNSTFVRNVAINGGGGGVLAGGPFSRAQPGSARNMTLEVGAAGRAVAVLNGSSFRENSAFSGGGVQAVELIMTSTDFISNSAAFGGGGANISGPAQLQGGKFLSNTTSNGSGGGLSAGQLQAQFTYFSANAATGGSIQQGGAIFLNSGPNDLDSVWFQNNEAQSNGGALYATGVTRLTGVSMISNTAHSGQGGGTFSDSPLVVLGGSYVDNYAAVSGGGIYALGLNVDGAHFDANHTPGNGAGLLADGAPLRISNSRFSDNVAGQHGGGVYANNFFDIDNTVFLHNQGGNGGGGLFHEVGGTGHVVNSLFARNAGSEAGAALVLAASAANVDIVHTTIADQPRNADIAINNVASILNISDTIIAGHTTGLNGQGVTQHGYMLYFDNGTDVLGNVFATGPITTADPLFAAVPVDDYHLRFNSPAIDAGAYAGVDFDIDGQPRPIGPQVDLGFDEAASSIQQMIDATPPGGTVNIPPGVYTESLRLDKPVSLIGAGLDNTIINAVIDQRVLTVTGSSIMSDTEIAELTLRGGQLISPTCSGFCSGGGVLITGLAYPTFRAVKITDNRATMGGGLYIQTGGARVISSSIMLNQAQQSGGGVYVESSAATLEQIGGAITSNQAVDGAGVFVQSGQFKQTGGAISNNTALHWGGGLLVGSGGVIKSQQGEISGNAAQSQGGGIFADVGQVWLENMVLLDNFADTGGGLYVRDYTDTMASLIGGKVDNNRANSYGGGIYAANTTFITGTRFFGNSAYDGSALEITGTAQVRLVNAFLGENVADGPFPSTNASVRFDSSGNSVVLHTTFGNGAQPLVRALAVNNGLVYVLNTIVASYSTGLSAFNGHLVEDYNLFFHTPLTTSGFISSGGHSLVGLDPQFKAPSNRDYHIKGMSPAVNRGTDVGVRRDIDLEARPLGGGYDIGADEASVAGTIVGTNIGGGFTYTTSQNSTINVNIPSGAVTQTAAIYCSLIPSDTVQPPRSFKFVGVVFELDANTDPLNVSPGSISFNQPVTLSVSYTDQQLAAAGITDELSLALQRFEPIVNDWKPIGFRPGETQTLDVDNDIITATVLGFSRWGMTGPTTVYDIFLPLVLRN
jgi:predicted outer membrane repeat protein